MRKCPQCGAPLNQQGNCGYCGYFASENIRQIITEQDDDWQESLDTIQNNLDILHDLPKPSVGEGLKAAFRIIAAIYTFGLILLFWKKPKKHLNLANYKKLKAIIQRNIKLLDIQMDNNIILREKVEILQDELNETDRNIQNSLWSRRIAFWALLIGFFILIASYSSDNQDYKIVALEIQQHPDLDNYLELLPDSVNLRVINISSVKKRLKIYITVHIKKRYHWDTANKLVFKLYLLNNKNTKLPLVLNLEGREYKKLIKALKTSKPEYLTLKFNKRIEVPDNLKFTDVAYYGIETNIENTD